MKCSSYRNYSTEISRISDFREFLKFHFAGNDMILIYLDVVCHILALFSYRYYQGFNLVSNMLPICVYMTIYAYFLQIKNISIGL